MLPSLRVFSISCLDFNLIALFVYKSQRLVLVRIILAREGQEQDAEKSGEGNDDAEDEGEGIVELVGEEVLAEHGWDGVGRSRSAARGVEKAASCVRGRLAAIAERAAGVDPNRAGAKGWSI